MKYGNAPYANEPYNPVGGANMPYYGCNTGNSFALIVVLFLLLIIVGAAFVKC
ncbi:YjcZ family sporulation protein [Alkalihalobacillus sp. R86527]|uniref:YjcZ family sporulation protein n=1 Tax=Alkalihalobacillus sp. R86527 TaxID=3093863 RepID=UPI00366FD7C8